MRTSSSSSSFIAAAISLATAEASRLDNATRCCESLLGDTLLEGKVYYPDTAAYEHRLDTYWSASAALEPWCMVLPETAEDTSHVMKIVSKHQCPFGIKSGGHGTFAGSNSVEKGITIDLGYMNKTTYDAETGLASVYPGSHWGPVYDALEPYGVVVTGGRAATVGVGGFITGGGNSFHSGRHGFGCDNVENFEVVLADGNIINANENEHSDLWVALRGGSANMGLVTRFDMLTIPYADPSKPEIFGGLVSYEVSKAAEIVDVYVEFGENVSEDPDSTVLIWWSYDPSLGGMSFLACLDNAANVANPPAMDGFLQNDGILSNSMRSGSMANITGELVAGGSGYYNIWFTSAFDNDARIINYAGKKHEELVHAVEAAISEGGYLSTLCEFQPITELIVDHAQGNNVMGLERHVAKGAGNMFLLYMALGSLEDEAIALPLVRAYHEDLNAYASSLDKNWNWEYINYAHREQDPVPTFGEENVDKLRKASAKYDPDGVFQKLRGAGFKLPA